MQIAALYTQNYKKLRFRLLIQMKIKSSFIEPISYGSNASFEVLALANVRIF